MNNKELIFTGFFLFTIYSQMSMKFILGFGMGLYVGTEYNVKPFVEYSKQHIILKINEVNETLETYKKHDKKSITSWFGISGISDSKKQ